MRLKAVPLMKEAQTLHRQVSFGLFISCSALSPSSAISLQHYSHWRLVTSLCLYSKRCKTDFSGNVSERSFSAEATLGFVPIWQSVTGKTSIKLSRASERLSRLPPVFYKHPVCHCFLVVCDDSAMSLNNTVLFCLSLFSQNELLWMKLQLRNCCQCLFCFLYSAL